MKRLFAKASKPFTPANRPLSEDTTGPTHATIPTSTVVHTPSLQPKYTVPPVPHPCPHEHLAILATRDGLLLRPHIPGQQTMSTLGSHVCISWDKSVKIVEVSDAKENPNWSEGAVIYGIVGILELYSCECVLQIEKMISVNQSYQTHTFL
jgi:hypothetical protein